jgi:hypothetical protein
MVERMIAEPDWRPEFRPHGTRGIDRINQLFIAPDRRAVARIAVGAQRPDRIDDRDPGEGGVPGQQATQSHMVEYQNGSQSNPVQNRNDFPEPDLALQRVGNVTAKPYIQA